jgi:hypothetical protein
VCLQFCQLNPPPHSYTSVLFPLTADSTPTLEKLQTVMDVINFAVQHCHDVDTGLSTDIRGGSHPVCYALATLSSVLWYTYLAG